MSHRVRRLCCIPALALLATFATGSVSQAQLQTETETRIMVRDTNGDPIPQSLMVIRDSRGHVLVPAGEMEGALVFTNVGRKLMFEFGARGPKMVPVELVLLDVPRVFIYARVDPLSGQFKELIQKPQPLNTGTPKTRRFPAGGQQNLVPPPNDDCASALPIGDGVTAWTTVDAITDGPANCLGQINRDVWWSYTATATGSLTVSTCNQTTMDTKIAIYTGLTCPPGLPIGCNDDFGGCASFTSIATAPVVAGSTYLIRLGAFGATSTGSGTITITPPAGPPAFDECAGAVDVGCNSSTVFNNSGGTTNGTDPAFSCRVGGAAQGFGTSWFKFMATATSATVDTEGSLTGDTLVAVYSGTCGALVEIGCDDDLGTGLLSSVTVAGLTIGQTYYVQVAGWGAGNVGTNTLNISCSGPQQGDDCNDPIVASCDSEVTVDLATMTVDASDPLFNCRVGGATQGAGTAWISFVATDTSVRVHTNNSTGSDDTILAVYDGTCGALVELCCDDDAGVGFLSELCCENLVIGNTYLIEVAAWSAGSLGEATVTIECPCPAPPANDDCDDAIALGAPPTSVVFDTTLATDDIGSPCGVGSGPFSNVWYTVTGTGNTITATTCNPGTSHPDTKISVFCGECGALVCVTGNDDDFACGFDPFFSTVSWCSQAGATYLVTVGGFASGQQGVVELSLTDDGVPCDPLVQCLPVGGCCLPDGSCVDATQGDCLAQGGVYQGDGTACNANAVLDPSFEQSVINPIPFSHYDSPEWTEASTNFESPTCSAAFCGTGLGTGPRTGIIWSWFGGINAFEEGSMEQLVTIPVGAASLDFWLEIPVVSGNGTDFLEVLIDGNPVFTVLESAGPYLGYQLVSVPLGGFADGGAHSIEFHSIISGAPQGTNFFVDDVSIDSQAIFCPQPEGACCLPDGSCIEVVEADCLAQGGVFSAPGVACVEVSCPQPTGACCLPDGTCVEVTEEDCGSLGGIFSGDFTTCASVYFVLDFETDDTGAPMIDRQRVDTELDGGPAYPVTLTSASYLEACGSVGNTAAVYDSDAVPHGQDTDLAVDSGNILILQTDLNLTTCAPGVFCTGNDDDDGGLLSFDFACPISPASVDLIDVDGSGPEEVVTITMTDSSARTRTYTVPAGWTGDLDDDGGGNPAVAGIRTLFLNTTAPQAGLAGSATAVEDALFDQNAVVAIDIDRGADCPNVQGGSGAIDNLIWCGCQ